jgi:hypothetical protein
MTDAHDFVLTGDHDAARDHVARALRAEGFSLTATPQGGFLANRGLIASVHVEFLPDTDGNLVMRMTRSSGTAIVLFGAIGAAKAAKAFRATVQALHSALLPTGSLVASAAR